MVKINWEGVKVLKNTQGNPHKPIYLNDREADRYPLMENCSIKYTIDKLDRGRVVLDKMCSVKYEKFNFTGILKIDEKGVFYIKCRNWKHEMIDIFKLPEGVRSIISDKERLC